MLTIKVGHGGPLIAELYIYLYILFFATLQVL